MQGKETPAEALAPIHDSPSFDAWWLARVEARQALQADQGQASPAPPLPRPESDQPDIAGQSERG